MRLLKLKIRNLASLRNEHIIDFVAIEKESPLFAITGETGAGKSTILNAIGLALFGKVYKSNVGQHDVVTLGEKDGQVELIFQVKDKYYLALWKVKVRKQSGELYSTPQSPQRELYLLEKPSFDAAKVITLIKIDDLIGLDFDQFCKCVILNQGEFARFLSSTFTERKEILEKMYSGQMLDVLGRELKLELDVLVKSKNDLEIELSTLQSENVPNEALRSLESELSTKITIFKDWIMHIESLEYHLISVGSYHSKYLETFNKSLSIKDEINRQTHSQNQRLLTLKDSETEHQNIITFASQRIPQLEILIKTEEQLASQTDLKNEKIRLISRHQDSLKEMGSKNESLIIQMSQLGIEGTRLEKLFSYPVDILLPYQKVLANYLEGLKELDFSEIELSNLRKRLLELEQDGGQKSNETKSILQKIESIPADIEKRLTQLEEQRKDLSKKHESRQRLAVLKKEVHTQIDHLHLKKKELFDKEQNLQNQILREEAEILPLNALLKTQNLLSAVEVCRTHPDVTDQCPVCLNPVNHEQWQNLRADIKKLDMTDLKNRHSKLERSLLKTQEELNSVKQLGVNIEEELHIKLKVIETYNLELSQNLEPIEQIDLEWDKLKKLLWERAKLIEDKTKLETELQRYRDHYTKTKTDIGLKEQQKESTTQKLSLSLTPLFKELKIPHQDISLLRQDAKELPSYIDYKKQEEKIVQEQKFINQNTIKEEKELQQEVIELNKLEESIKLLKNQLFAELGNKKALDEMRSIHQSTQDAQEKLTKAQKDLKSQTESMKLLQGQVYTLEEHLKDLELHFKSELKKVKNISKVALPSLSSEVELIISTCQKIDFDFQTPPMIIQHLTESIQKQKEALQTQNTEATMELARVHERLLSLEKRLDRIQLLQFKAGNITQELNRKLRLYEVLGKDELRTFVLSLVEENLIAMCNEELQKLCLGRYEIVHQSGRMRLPEFYVMDKFKEGELRKVSTLSGGETFMVSLAMALGLAEMTRGQAEIDTLFIDEGFGTLDQESLEDVIDMLNQIQNRGLMIGIISHVKALTSALPINLHVAKKRDGTSNLNLVYN